MKKYKVGQRIRLKAEKNFLKAVEEKEKDIFAHGLDCWLGCDEGVWFLEIFERR